MQTLSKGVLGVVRFGLGLKSKICGFMVSVSTFGVTVKKCPRDEGVDYCAS